MRLALSAVCLALVVTACSGGDDEAALNTGVPSATPTASGSATPTETATPSDPANTSIMPAIATAGDSCKRVFGPDPSPIEVGLALAKAESYGPKQVEAARYAAQVLTEARTTAPPRLRKLIGQALELPQAVVDAVDSGINGFNRDVPTFADAARGLAEVCLPYATD